MVVVCLALWAALSGVLTLRLRREYDQGGVTKPTGALIWIWHSLNYGLLVLFGIEDVWRLHLPEGVRVVGGVLVVCGVAVIGAGFYEFRSIARLTGTRQDEVIDTGVYRFSRHPQYLGIILTLVGLAVIVDSAAAVLLSLALTATFLVYLPVEERYVSRAFGSAYEEYRERVPMLLGWRD